MKKAKKIIVIVLKVIAYSICLLLIWRVLFANDKHTNTAYTATPAAVGAARDGELSVFTNKAVESQAEKGYFYAYGFRYTPETGEVQVTVKYNDATIEKVGPVHFEALLVDTTAKMNSGDTFEGYPILLAAEASDVTTEKKLFYNYDKLVFEGFDNLDETKNVVIRLVYEIPADEDDTDKVESTVVVHYAEQEMKEYKLSGKEKTALGLN